MSIEHSSNEPNLSADNRNHQISTIDQYDQARIANTIRQVKKMSMTPTPLEYSWCSTHRTLTTLGISILLMCSTMILAILLVCLTSPKTPERTCKYTFKTTIKYGSSNDSYPRHVVVGYFNQDHHPDLVVANSGANNIGIYIGYGNGSFISQMTYPTGYASRPYWVGVEDFNDDSLLDIIVANYGTNNIGVFLNHNNGTFGDVIFTSLGASRPLSFAHGDFNHDPYIDIAVISNGTLDVTILLGQGNGSFRTDRSYKMGYDSIPSSIALADFNHDNQLDMAIVNDGTSTLVILLSVSKNNTYTEHKYTTGTHSHPTSVAIGDINNDHQSDIVVTNAGTDNIYIFLGSLDGSFLPKITLTSESLSHPQSITLFDMNNDRKLDLIVTNTGNDNVLIFNGDANGNFMLVAQHATGFHSDPCAIAIGDFDHDRKQDIVIINNGINNILVLASYTIYPNASETTYSTGQYSYPGSVALGDFNSDNQLDIIVANSATYNIGLFLGFGDGTFQESIYFPVAGGLSPHFIATADFNNDQQLDVVVVIYYGVVIQIYLGQSNGSFQYANTYSTGMNSGPQFAATGDFNNDKHLDILTAHCAGDSVGVFLNYGNGTFTNVTHYSTGTYSCPKSIAVGDFNNDTILDFVVANFLNSILGIYLGYGNGSFKNSSLIFIGPHRPKYVITGDLNNDHQLDIVFISPESYYIGIFLGNGNGSFRNASSYSKGYFTYATAIVLADFNRDTIPDLAISDESGSGLLILLGYGNGTFASPMLFFNDISSTMATGDLNNDGQIDIVLVNNEANTISVILIYPQGKFLSETFYSTGSASHPYAITTGDFNQDNQTDIGVTYVGHNQIELLMNYQNGSFKNRTTIITGLNSHPQYLTNFDFNQDHRLDLVIANTWNHSIGVFTGLQNSTFALVNVYSTGSESFPNSIAIGNFNNDTWIDLAVTNSGTNNIAVFLGFNYIAFVTHYIYFSTFTAKPFYIRVDDFNNDSQWDLAVINKDEKLLHIFLGYGNGSFMEKISSITNDIAQPQSLAIGDFNNDMKLDIVVVSSPGGNSILVFLGRGDGTFEQIISNIKGYMDLQSVALGNFNNDHCLDIVVTDRPSGDVIIYLGLCDGSFFKAISYNLSQYWRDMWVVVGDFNKDYILDIAVAIPWRGRINILLGKGNGTFDTTTTLYTGENSYPCSSTVGDFDKDNFIDIVVVNGYSKNIGIFFGYGNGSFSAQTTYAVNFVYDGFIPIAVDDLNNDGILDIALTSGFDKNECIYILYGIHHRRFTMPVAYKTDAGSGPTSIVICDFNNDGQPDLAVTNSRKTNIAIMLHDKSQPFHNVIFFPTGNNSKPTSIVVNDFNHDDQLDMIVSNSGTSNIGIFLGYGNGSFANQILLSSDSLSSATSIIAEDFNKDGQLDIAVVNTDGNSIGIFFGFGNGTFGMAMFYFTGIRSAPSSIAVADLNKDNRLDLVIANRDTNDVLVWYGGDKGLFPKENSASYSVGYNARPQGITIGDFDNDGWLDIAVTDYQTNYVEVLLQTC